MWKKKLYIRDNLTPFSPITVSYPFGILITNSSQLDNFAASIISGCTTAEMTTEEKVDNVAGIVNEALILGALVLIIDNLE